VLLCLKVFWFFVFSGFRFLFVCLFVCLVVLVVVGLLGVDPELSKGMKF